MGVRVMKICWDNLYKFTYDKINNVWKNKFHVVYKYRESCIICGIPYLDRKTSPSNFCSGSCAKSGKNHHMFGKKHSFISRKKLSNSLKGHSVSKNTRNKLSIALQHNKNSRPYKGGVTKLNLPLYDTYKDRLEWCNDIRRSKNNTNILEIMCKKCGKWFVPTRTAVCERINALKYDNRFGECNLYCSDSCKYSCDIYGQKLYPKNYDVEKEYTKYDLSIWRNEVISRANNKCEYCDKPAVHAHHIIPKKINQFFVLDPDYGIACCIKCHFKYGHSGECSTGKLAKEICS